MSPDGVVEERNKDIAARLCLAFGLDTKFQYKECIQIQEAIKKLLDKKDAEASKRIDALVEAHSKTSGHIITIQKKLEVAVETLRRITQLVEEHEMSETNQAKIIVYAKHALEKTMPTPSQDGGGQ